MKHAFFRGYEYNKKEIVFRSRNEGIIYTDWKAFGFDGNSREKVPSALSLRNKRVMAQSRDRGKRRRYLFRFIMVSSCPRASKVSRTEARSRVNVLRERIFPSFEETWRESDNFPTCERLTIQLMSVRNNGITIGKGKNVSFTYFRIDLSIDFQRFRSRCASRILQNKKFN